MPYIPDKLTRKLLNIISDSLIYLLEEKGITGNLNYFLFRTYKHLVKNYADMAHFEGDVQKSMRELFRRIDAPYEDKKIKENGDVE